MTDAVVLIPAAGMTTWLDRCGAYCATRGYRMIAVATCLDDGLRLLHEKPDRKLIIVSLEMLGDVEIATASVMAAALEDDPSRPTTRRPTMPRDAAPERARPTLRAVA